MLLENIKRLCQENGITIAYLEQATGMGNGSIRKWNTCSPSLENAMSVAKYFSISLDQLTKGSDTSEI